MLLQFIERLGRFNLYRRGVRSRYFETSIARLHAYEAYGTGNIPLTVVLHGIGSGATAYGSLLQCLRKYSRRVFVPEAPGHGFSETPLALLTSESLLDSLSAVLDQEISEPAVLFGNSLGGGMALRYAIKRPEKVRAVVVSSPAGGATSPEILATLIERFRLSSKQQARAFMKTLYHRTPWYSFLLAGGIQQRFERPAIQRFLTEVKPEDQFTPHEVAQINMPLLLLWGKADTLLPIESFHWFRQHLPSHARIREVEHFGHCPHLEHPRELASLIGAFAQEHA